MSVGDEVQLVTFRVASHEFAFNVFQVERILRYEVPAPLPNAPEFLEGTVQYGDFVVPVIDLRKRLSVEAPVGDDTRVVIIETEHGKAGLIVDAVREVMKLEADRVKPPPKLVKGLAAKYISGIVTKDDRTIVVLAAAKLLTAKEHLALAELTLETAHE